MCLPVLHTSNNALYSLNHQGQVLLFDRACILCLHHLNLCLARVGADYLILQVSSVVQVYASRSIIRQESAIFSISLHLNILSSEVWTVMSKSWQIYKSFHLCLKTWPDSWSRKAFKQPYLVYWHHMNNCSSTTWCPDFPKICCYFLTSVVCW